MAIDKTHKCIHSPAWPPAPTLQSEVAWKLKEARPNLLFVVAAGSSGPVDDGLIRDALEDVDFDQLEDWREYGR